MLELKNVSYEVNEDQREIEILKNINLKIEERFVAITGPNGGGKSTLAKIIAGILVPTSGQILLDGEDITGMNITERAKAGISFAFQQPVRFKGLSVRDLLEISAPADEPSQARQGRVPAMSKQEKAAEIARLEKAMKEAAKMLEFELAATLRDQIIELRGQ